MDVDVDDEARSAAQSTVQATAKTSKAAIVVEGCAMTRRIAARPTVVRTLSRGKVQLRTKDPRDKPRMFGNYFHHERDLLILIEGMKAAAKLSEMASLHKWGFRVDETPVQGCQHLPFASDQYWG